MVLSLTNLHCGETQGMTEVQPPAPLPGDGPSPPKLLSAGHPLNREVAAQQTGTEAALRCSPAKLQSFII